MSDENLVTRWCPKCGGEMAVEDTGPVCARCALASALVRSGGEGQSVELNLQDIPAPGEKVSYIGDYELLSVIAQGGMGVVYRARQRTLNREVALKLLLGGAHASKDFKKRFLQEAETAGKLQHPNIVPIYEVGEHEGQPFFSMEYVAGSDLAKRTREQPMEPKNAAESVKIVAEAIEYAHQQGILHRDLKPSNILVGREGRLRITDFGLARETKTDSSLTLTGTTLGTPGFMPPEQVSVKRGEVGPPSDVYSLGAVLYCLVTGRAPFAAGTVADILQQVVNTEPISPRQLNPAVPRDLETICLKCLEKEPRRRYPTAQMLADDLGRYIRGEPISARPISASERVVKWYRREPVVAGLITAVIVALLLGFGFSSWQWRNARKMQLLAQGEAKRNQDLTGELTNQVNNANAAWKEAEGQRQAAEKKQTELEKAQQELIDLQAKADEAERSKAQLAADAEAKVQEASRANQLALKESGGAASKPSVAGAAPASGGAAEGGSAGVARDRTKEAEVLLEQAAEASLRADEAHKALAAKLTSLRPGSAEYRSTASQANDALVRAHAQMAELRKATLSFEKASPPTRPVVAAPLGPPTISVARTEATSVSGWQPAMGEGFAHMLITEMARLNNFKVLESVALDDLRAERALGESGEVSAKESVKKGQWQGSDYILKCTITRFGSKENNYGGSGAGVPPVRGLPFGLSGVNISFKKSENEVQIDWRIIDAASRLVISGAAGRAIGVEKGSGFNIGTLQGGGFNNSSEFMESALGKATMKALSNIVVQLRPLALPAGARTTTAQAEQVQGAIALKNVKGVVKLVEGKQIWVSLGAAQGLKTGDRVRIYKPIEKKNTKGEVIATTYQVVAEISLIKVQNDKSMGEYAGAVQINEDWAVAEASVDIEQVP